MMLRSIAGAIMALVAILSPETAFAADGIDGTKMSILWVIPFAMLLGAIATGPLLFPHFWEHHQGKIAAICAVLVVAPLAFIFGAEAALKSTLHVMLLEYLSFIILLFALYTIAGGIWIQGNIHGSPVNNLLILLIGTVLASFVGTTGASMMLIRPIIRANDNRTHNAHVVIFFIFLVSNMGGALTPLGDPPLFVGFLKGVDFFWPTIHLFHETVLVWAMLLGVFFVIDSHYYKKEGIVLPDKTPDSPIRIKGAINFFLLGGVIVAVLISAYWKPGIKVPFPGGAFELQNILRDVVLILLALISLRFTKVTYRNENGFSWGPIVEVAKLFAGIFICVLPVIAILQVGENGALSALVKFVSNPNGTPNNAMYFWMVGILSSMLDNAPTYLVFFELAGGDATVLMGKMAKTLAAISTGAVFMGANTYIGNAPNFMVYAIAKNMGVRMPSFFGYMRWSGAILIPTFILVTLIFFR